MSLTPNLKFDILDTYDKRILRIADISEWKHLVSEESFIDIEVPARTSVTTQRFQKESINIFNSNNLEITSDDLQELPDGIYKFTIYVCKGDKFSYSAYYLRTVDTLLRLDQILIDLKLHCCIPDDKLLNKYSEIELLIKGAHAHLRDGDVNQASCLYEKALDLLEGLEECLDKTKTC
jgi:hypothetical protein